MTVSDELPLRGVLKCQCGKVVTGAPSRGRHGGHFYYYKCVKSKHLSLSAKKAHDQLSQVFDFMSIPSNIIKARKDESETAINLHIKNDNTLLAEKHKELAQEDAKMLSIEEKWISNQINHDTYQNGIL